MKKVEMWQARERRGRAMQAIARFKQRLIEGSAVIGNEDIEVFEIAEKRVELAGFFVITAHEELADAKAIGGDGADADQKRTGAEAAGKSRGFGIEKRPFLRGNGRAFESRRREKVVRQGRQRADIGASVVAMMLPQLFGFVMTAERGFDFLAGKEFFDRHAERRRQGTRVVLAIDGFDQFPKIDHSPFICPMLAV